MTGHGGGTPVTGGRIYKASVGTRNAAWLAAESGIGGITDNGDGTASFGLPVMRELRELPDERDGYMDPTGLMWIAGASYPVIAGIAS
jgi:hypothetical protein